jgi:hypothetical protein
MPEELLVQSYDDEAELQARIWNAFALAKHQSGDFLIVSAISFKATVMVEQIVNS